jgi:hypothetical protein
MKKVTIVVPKPIKNPLGSGTWTHKGGYGKPY